MGGYAFIRNGFKGWNRPNGLDKHAERVNSIQNQATEKYESLMKPKTSIQRVFNHRSHKVKQAFDDEELESGKGLHQELGLGTPGDTRWGSHDKLILNFIALYHVIRDVHDKIGDMSSSFDHDKLNADVVSFANVLNVYLQKKDQDIINAMSFVKSTKEQLQKMRDRGWHILLGSEISFCGKNCIKVPNMEDLYVPRGRKRRGQQHITNDHHFLVEVFYMIVDLQLQELNARFDEVTTNLLVCMASLSPLDAFISYDKQKLLKLAEFYPREFSSVELLSLDHQLDTYIHEMRNDGSFLGLKTIGEISMKLVESNKHKSFDLVYLLIKLVLILPVAMASVERSFSAMKFMKNKLRNSLSDQS